MVEELSQFSNVYLCITSRVSTTPPPPDCKHRGIPSLSMDAVRHTFYRIYDGERLSNPVNDILEQLDFHPLSITLLGTVAHHNKRGPDRLIRERDRQRTGMFLEVVAFFPKTSMKITLTGCFLTFPTERISSTDSAFFL